jgi:cyclic beta-1,2-glucan synthetase
MLGRLDAPLAVRPPLIAERHARPALILSGLALLATSVWLAMRAGPLAADLLVGLLGSIAIALQARAGTGRWPSAIHALIDAALVAGLAAMATQAAKVWQPPGTWHDLATLTPLGAATSVGLYLAATSWLAGRGSTHAPVSARVLVAAVPLLANWLLLLGSAPLTLELGRLVTAGIGVGPALEIGLGRTLVLALFDVALIIGIGRVMDGRVTRDGRFYALVAGSSLLAAFTPQIASLASALGSVPGLVQIAGNVAAAAAAQAGLWAQVFLVTGIALDALKGRRPTRYAAVGHLTSGMTKGAVYGGLFILLAQAAAMLAVLQATVALWQAAPLLTATLAGALLFPLGRTLVESFDGSAPFFRRLAANARVPWDYARGAVIGAGVGLAVEIALPTGSDGARFGYGLALGMLAYAGVDLARDGWLMVRGPRGCLQSWRVYLLALLLGGVVGGAVAWYLDASQLDVLRQKLWAYATVSNPGSQDYVIYPLFSKYGALSLGPADGGVRLFFNESLSGVINWSLAAPLFSINLVLLSALVHRSLWPLRGFLTPAGLVGVVEQTIRVMRWGLWMAPVIYSGLRMAPDPTWYNQDGAVRTVVATAASWWLPADQFRTWSLHAFLGLLAYDWLRVLIWFDHMGLRVATLVNLSFVGGDAADERAARFLGHPGHTRIVPEGLRRFATWAPLLIPFYIPRGSEWDYVWAEAERMQGAPLPEPVGNLMLGYAVAGIAIAVVAGLIWRRLASQPAAPAATQPVRIANGLCTLELAADGRGHSRAFSLVSRGT